MNNKRVRFQITRNGSFLGRPFETRAQAEAEIVIEKRREQRLIDKGWYATSSNWGIREVTNVKNKRSRTRNPSGFA